MTITEILIPASIKVDVRASIGRWFKRAGDPVSLDEPLVEIEIGNMTHEVRASVTGVLSEILVKDGQSIGQDVPLGTITTY